MVISVLIWWKKKLNQHLCRYPCLFSIFWMFVICYFFKKKCFINFFFYPFPWYWRQYNGDDCFLCVCVKYWVHLETWIQNFSCKFLWIYYHLLEHVSNLLYKTNRKKKSKLKKEKLWNKFLCNVKCGLSFTFLSVLIC